jgi:hypothetical protein
MGQDVAPYSKQEGFAVNGLPRTNRRLLLAVLLLSTGCVKGPYMPSAECANMYEAVNRAEASALKAESAAQRANFEAERAQGMARRVEEQCKPCK